jgi:hypothetical protein
MLGARVGTMYAAGNVYGDYYDYYDHHYSYPPQHGPELHMSDVASWGYMFEGDLGFHFSPCWTVYGFWEHGELDHGDFNVDKWGHTNAAGIGATVNTAPYDRIGAYFDFGASYRWMTFTDVTVDPANPAFTRTTVEGFDFLRTAIGVSIAMSRTFRLDPHLYVSSGYFTRFKGATCPGGCSFDSQNIDLGYHTLSGIAVSGHFDLSL